MLLFFSNGPNTWQGDTWVFIRTNAAVRWTGHTQVVVLCCVYLNLVWDSLWSPISACHRFSKYRKYETVYLAISQSWLSRPLSEKLHFCMSDKHTITMYTSCTILIRNGCTMDALCAVVKEHVNNLSPHPHLKERLYMSTRV